MARARAEVRRAEAIACQQEMKAKVAQSRAMLVLAEAEIPAAIALAFRAGQFHVKRPAQPQRDRLRDPQPEISAREQTTSPREPHDGRLPSANPKPKVKGEHE